MRYFSFIAAAALAFTTTTATAQKGMSLNSVKSMVKTLLRGGLVKAESRDTGFDNMSASTTKPSQTSSYVYAGGSWKFVATTKTEYNQKGYATATETTGTEGNTRVEYTYDDSYDGFVTKTTNYSWDEASKSWTNPIVTAQVELTKNSKGRVTKETIYTYDEDSKTPEKEMEVNYDYALISGKLYKISTTITQEGQDGNDISIPVTLIITKWHKYNENKLFGFSLDEMDSGFLGDKDNQIESATMTMTMPMMGMDIPITATIKGTYGDTQTKMEVGMSFLGQDITTTTTVDVTDQYGSTETNVSTDAMGKNVMTSKTVSTNNEHGDCIKTETTSTGTEGLGNIFGDDSDEASADALNQSLTFDYEYYTLPDNNVLKKSMTTNTKDKLTNEFKPTAKVDYWGYTDYVSGATGIESVLKNSVKTQNKAIYSINGEKLNNIPTDGKKGVYIVKEADKTIKIMK